MEWAQKTFLIRRVNIIFIPLLLAAVVHAAEPLPKGYLFYHSDFGEKTLAVTTGSLTLTTLPVEQMRGYTIRGTAWVRAENVSAKPNSWNGIKFMCVIETPTGRQWPQAAIEAGTFDWQHATFTAKVPQDAIAVTLCLGLENVTGKAWFDNVTITVVKPPLPTASVVQTSLGPPFTGHGEQRLRGAMVSPDIDEAGLHVLGRDWHANLIRWQLVRHNTSTSYDQWLEGECRKLDAVLAVCEEVGLRIVVDLHSPPGGKLIATSGYTGSDNRLFTDKACQTKFVEVWRRLATRYKNTGVIWGYDLANEPDDRFREENCDDWQALAEQAAKAIRAIDPQRAIIVEPASGGGPGGLLDFEPIPVSNVVYSVHMYEPGEFTQQGVIGKTGVHYPGNIAGRNWDKAQLEAALQPVVNFQKKYGVHFYIGEFSAIRWAPDDSAYRYLKDVIEIFESHGWDWSYHAFREWDGWSVEHSSDKDDHKPVATPTDRQRLLCTWFARNIGVSASDEKPK